MALPAPYNRACLQCHSRWLCLQYEYWGSVRSHDGYAAIRLPSSSSIVPEPASRLLVSVRPAMQTCCQPSAISCVLTELEFLAEQL